jgi:transposase InsO family protein
MRQQGLDFPQWLSDNASAYIVKETSQIVMELGLRLAFTPVRSPESNGISEAFVKTLKRDFAQPDDPVRCSGRHRPSAGLVWEPQQRSPALWTALSLTPRVPQPQSLDRKGLSGRGTADSKRVLKPDLETPCGPRPLRGSIAATDCDTKQT